MNKLEPVHPEQRNPKLCMIGLPSLGDGCWELSRVLSTLELTPPEQLGGWSFKVYRCQEQGIGKARDILTHIARCVGASQLIMVDRDVAPTIRHFLRLLSTVEDGVEFVGACYPKRMTPLSWVGEFRSCEPGNLGPKGLWPADSVGTGLIRVALSAIDRIIGEFGNDLAFEFEDSVPGGGIPHRAKMYDVWGMGPRNDVWVSGQRFTRYVTEDYMASYLFRLVGGACWVDPECQVEHYGRIGFLDLEARIEARIDEALRRYRADLRSVGIEVPVLLRDASGNVVRGDGKETAA